MSNDTQREQKSKSKVIVYVKDNELWVLGPVDRNSKEFATHKLNDVFENLEVIKEGNTPEFCLIDDDFQITYEDGETRIVKYLGDWIVPEDEE